jgi:hypothetical protein
VATAQERTRRVRASRVDRRARADRRRQRRIRTAVDREIDLRAQQEPVAGNGRAMPDPAGMAFGRRGHVLRTVVHHLHRVPALEREQRRMSTQNRRIVLLAAEGSAGLRLDHAHLVIAQAERYLQRAMHIERALQGARDSHARNRSICIPCSLGKRSVGLNVELFLRTRVIFPLDDQVSPCERLIQVAMLQQEALEHVWRCARPRDARTPDDFFQCDRFLHVEDRRQLLICDPHRRNGRGQPLLIRVRQQQNRLLRMVHPRVLPRGYKQGLILKKHRHHVASGNVVRGDDTELMPRNLPPKLDVGDESARNRRTHGGAMPHVLYIKVVEIACLAAQLGQRFLPRYVRADNAGLHPTTPCNEYPEAEHPGAPRFP